MRARGVRKFPRMSEQASTGTVAAATETKAAETLVTSASTDAGAVNAADAVKNADTGKVAAVETKTEAAKTGDTKDAGEAQAASAAPEKYEFKAPEGKTFDSEVIGKYSEVAKELNLSQESAQKLLDKVAPILDQRQAALVEATHRQWIESTKADKEFGGEKLTQNLATAKKALDQFGTPELKSLLNASGMGNHPELIRFFYRAGKSISEDTFVSSSGTAASKGQPRDFNAQADALYPNTKQGN